MKKILKLLKCDISWIPLYKELIWLVVLCFACINFSCAYKISFDNFNFNVTSLPISWFSGDFTLLCSFNNDLWNLRLSLYWNVPLWWMRNESSYKSYSYIDSWKYFYSFSSSDFISFPSDYFINSVYIVSWGNYLNFASYPVSCDFIFSSFFIDIWWWIWDCTEYEQEINTLSWSLAICQSDLTTCQNTNSCTQLKCENDYNLVPESSINSEYCEDRFDLIDPENCPASWWTWDIQWSSFFVNSRQIQGAWNIYLWLPDFLDWWYTYIDNWQTLEIDVENVWDENYINTILSTQTYHPSSDEFAVSFVWYLTLLMPYIIITLFIVFVWKLIRRIFK